MVTPLLTLRVRFQSPFAPRKREAMQRATNLRMSVFASLSGRSRRLRLAALTACIGGLLLMSPQSANAADDVAPLDAAAATITVAELRKHIDFLASDTLQGREGGTVGNHAAGAYLTGKVKLTSLVAAGDEGEWFQYFRGNMRNIIGVWPGTDPTLKDEFVLVGAHYDHVGFGAPGNSRGPIGYVHNGADDNASGTAALLEIIDALSSQKIELKRSVLFAFWDSEEKGLLGSKHFVATSQRPLEKVRLVLNADMLGRLRDAGLGVYGWRTATGMRQWISRQNSDRLRLDFTLRYVADSDHWPFFELGIPSLMLHSGKHDDYHRPTDDTDRINFQGLQQVTQFLLRLTAAAANSDELPRFREQVRTEVPNPDEPVAQAAPPLRAPARLGASFDAEQFARRVVRVMQIAPDSAASEAGLRVGDEVVELGGFEVKDWSDFRALVLAAKSPCPLKIKRANEMQELSVRLRGNAIPIGLEVETDNAEPQCWLVKDVVPGSVADVAGLKRGQRIWKVAGQAVTGRESVAEMLLTPPSPVSLEVEHDGRIGEFKLRRVDAK